MTWTLLDLAICIIYFYVLGVIAYIGIALLRKFAPDWLRNTEFGKDLGLQDQDNN